MLPDEPQPVDEKKILTMQYVALAMMILLFFGIWIPASWSYESDMVQVTRIIIPVAYIPILFIGLSSIKYKVSIFRSNGSKQHTTGKQATTAGIIIIVAYSLNIIIVFSPILDIFIP